MQSRAAPGLGDMDTSAEKQLGRRAPALARHVYLRTSTARSALASDTGDQYCKSAAASTRPGGWPLAVDTRHPMRYHGMQLAMPPQVPTWRRASLSVAFCSCTYMGRGRSVVRSVGGEADGGAAEGAAGGGLDPWHGAGPVEAVAAGEVRQHVARPELLQAHRTLSLLLLLRRLLPPAPAEPPAASFLREHLPL
jgi:hypothetical protein